MQFNMGEPFDCLEQLMAVLPPYSSNALPECFKELMFEDDSEIIDFYPSEFAVDIKGKSFSWLGEVILPFINEKRLKRALESRMQLLKKDELKRNHRGTHHILINSKHSSDQVSEEGLEQVKGKFEPESMLELLRLNDTNVYDEEVNLTAAKLFKSELQSGVVSFKYTMPDAPPHDCQLKPGVQMPPRYLPANVSFLSYLKVAYFLVHGIRRKVPVKNYELMHMDSGEPPSKV